MCIQWQPILNEYNVTLLCINDDDAIFCLSYRLSGA